MAELTDRAVPVTVVIAARNEAADIAGCIASVRWASEVVVVENDSTDDTVTRARRAGAEVFSHPFTTIGAQRNAAIARARHEWVLVLDADERATAGLGEELARHLASATARAAATVAWRVARRNLFFGREIRHGGWERDRPIRFFRRTLRYDERPVHEHVVTDGPVGTLDGSIMHEPYSTLDEYFGKMVRYGHDWAAQHHARGRRAGVWSPVLRGPARFLTMYVVRGGWRDGAQGVLLAALAGISVATKYACLWERCRQPRNSRKRG